jgi:hypothetical protein
MPVVIATIGFSVFINHNGDPLFHRITKQCCRRYFPIHKSFTFLGIDDFEEDDREEWLKR